MSRLLLTLLAFLLCLGAGAQPRQFEPHRAGKDTVELTLHAMDELDFWTKARVFEYRKQRVLEHLELAAVFLTRPEAYQPDQKVFGEIEDGKAWWGILGLNYYGSGKQSIKGPSEETRFLGNPYLFAGVIERWAYQPRPLPAKLVPYYPLAKAGIWSLARRRFTARYDVYTYLRRADQLQLERRYTEQLSVVLYNARDFGFTHAELPEGLAHNISVEEPSGPFEIPQMLHAGTSAGYPGRANNMSPAFPKLDITVKKLPARFDVLLWRTQPEPGQKPTLSCTVLLE